MGRVRLFLVVFLLGVSSAMVSAQLDCPETVPLTFQLGDTGHILSGITSRLRDVPSLEGEILQEMPAKTVFTVQGDATCKESLRWWPIEANGAAGWVAEGAADGSYYMGLAEMERPAVVSSPVVEAQMQDYASDLAWAPDHSRLALSTGKGVWIYAGDDLTADPRLLFDQAAGVSTLAFDPNDSNVLYTGSSNGFISRWDVAAGHVEHITRFDTAVISVFMSQTGQALGVVLKNRDVYVLAPASDFAQVKITPEQTINSIPTRAVFSHDGTMIAIATNTGKVQVYDLAGQLLKAFTLRGTVTYAVAFSPDDTQLAASDGNLSLWDVASQTPIAEGLTNGNEAEIEDIFFVSNGQLLTIGGLGLGSPMILWDLQTLTVTKTFSTTLVGSSVVSPDGTTLTYIMQEPGAYSISRIQQLDLATMANPLLLLVSGATADSVVSPDGSQTMRSLSDEFRLVDTQTGETIVSLPHATGSVAFSTFSADGRYFAACVNTDYFSWMPNVVVYDLKGEGSSTEPLTVFSASWEDGASVLCDFLTFVPTSEGEHLVFDVYSESSEIVQMDLITGETTPLPFDGRTINRAVVWGTTLVTNTAKMDEPYEIAVYDLAQPTSAPRTFSVDVQYSPVMDIVSDTMLALTLGYDGRDVALYDLTTLQETLHLSTPSGISALAASHDGAWLATAHNDGLVRLWSLAAPAAPVVVGASGSSYTSVTFSADDQQLYANGYTWDVSSIVGK